VQFLQRKNTTLTDGAVMLSTFRPTSLSVVEWSEVCGVVSTIDILPVVASFEENVVFNQTVLISELVVLFGKRIFDNPDDSLDVDTFRLPLLSKARSWPEGVGVLVKELSRFGANHFTLIV
jgi:hypothetical protein